MLKEIEIKTQDGLLLRGVYTEIKNYNKILMVVHGLGEHTGRYIHVAEYFEEKGIAWIGFDLRGHGRSEGQRGHIPNMYLADDDAERMLKAARSIFPTGEIYAMGQSMGANLLMASVLRKKLNVSGILLASGWFGLAFQPPGWKVLLAKIVNSVAGNIALESEINPYELSHDPETALKYIKDDLVQKKISARLYSIIQHNIAYLMKEQKHNSVPIYIYHGSDDHITSAEKSAALFEISGGKKQFKIFNGMKHECHNEKNYREVLETIERFISQ